MRWPEVPSYSLNREITLHFVGPVFMCQDYRKPRSGSPFRVSPWR